MVVAASDSRRSSLVRMLRQSGATKGWKVDAAPQLSLEKFGLSRTNVLIADLPSHHVSVQFLQGMKDFPDSAGIVALVDDPEPSWVRTALREGVHAIIARDSDAGEIALAVEAADAGYVLLHPTSARMVSDAAPVLSDLDPANEMEHLTAREREVLGLMSGGLGNKEIAARMGISEHTVKFHTSSILAKLSASSRTEAVSQGIKRGLIAL